MPSLLFQIQNDRKFKVAFVFSKIYINLAKCRQLSRNKKEAIVSEKSFSIDRHQSRLMNRRWLLQGIIEIDRFIFTSLFCVTLLFGTFYKNLWRPNFSNVFVKLWFSLFTLFFCGDRCLNIIVRWFTHFYRFPFWLLFNRFKYI